MNKLKQYQFNAFIVTISLILFSIYIVFDASNAWASYKFQDEYYYLKKQCVYSIIAIGALIFGTRINIEKYKRFLLPATIFCFILLGLVLIPGIGIYKGGSYSWLGFSFISFQPSELFKIVSILFIAYYLDEKFFVSQKVKTFIPIVLIILLATILIMLQPDFGTLIVYLGAVFIMLFLSKLPIKYFLMCIGVGLVAFSLMIITEPYRLERITSYIDPFSDPLGSGFQIIQSMFAVGPGGLIGTGVNQSVQKYYYLPEPQTDFIYAIIVEEFGLLGGLIILFVYGYLFYLLFKISVYKHNRFNFLYSIGILALIAIQVIINLGVVTALFPVTGITLPFLSYGGSSLITLSFGVGLIIGGKSEDSIGSL